MPKSHAHLPDALQNPDVRRACCCCRGDIPGSRYSRRVAAACLEDSLGKPVYGTFFTFEGRSVYRALESERLSGVGSRVRLAEQTCCLR
jgi:hypothetical protein